MPPDDFEISLSVPNVWLLPHVNHVGWVAVVPRTEIPSGYVAAGQRRFFDELSLTSTGATLNFFDSGTANRSDADSEDLSPEWEADGEVELDLGSLGSVTWTVADTSDPYSLPANTAYNTLWAAIVASTRASVTGTLTIRFSQGSEFEAAATGSVEVEVTGTAAAILGERHDVSATGSVEVEVTGTAAATHGETGETLSASATGSVEVEVTGTAVGEKRTPTPGNQGSYYGDEATGDIWIYHEGVWSLLYSLDPSGKQKWYFRQNAPQASLGSNGENCYAWSTGSWYRKESGVWELKEDLTGLPGLGGSDGNGFEYIFTSVASPAAITDPDDLPLASQNYDVDALREPGGLVYGTQAYYDGTPPDLSKTRPYLIRFRRKVPGAPAIDEDLGDIDWTQDEPLLVIGQDGYGQQAVYTRTATADPPANPTDLDDADYQGDNYVPDDWENNPQGTTDALPYEWVSARIRITGGAWGSYSDPAPWGVRGDDGTDGNGIEYIFTANENDSEITDPDDLPLASQNYDVDALRKPGGLVYGTQAYYDGTPKNLSKTRPYLIRFRRKVPGQPALNAEIGEVAWIQEDAVLIVGQDGAGEQTIFTRTSTSAAPDNPTPDDISTAAYQADSYVPPNWTDEPTGVDDDFPFEWIARRQRATGGAWSAYGTITKWVIRGEDGAEGVGVEYIFTSKADANQITGSANLPLQSQNYDVDALRTTGGLVRGAQKYYDGTPPDISDSRPYLIRFRRKIPGQPDQNENIGSFPWTQERALRVAGFDGPTLEFVYLQKDDPNTPTRISTTNTEDGTDGHVPPAGTGESTSDEPRGVTAAARYEFEARRKRSSVGDPWGKFTKWTRVDTYVDGDTGLASPAVYNAPNPPAQSLGFENDTYVEVSGLDRVAVWKKLDGAWVRVSANPDDSAWTTGAGEPTSSANNGSYYGDNETGNVWVRHSGVWHWAIDLDPSGAVTWRFGSGAPSNSLGSNGDRYYRWTNGVWYERAIGSYSAKGDLTSGYAVVGRNTAPAAVGFRSSVDGTSIQFSWGRNSAKSYNNVGAPRPLLAWCGAIKKSTDSNWPEDAIVDADVLTLVLTDLKPNITYNARVCALYDNGAGTIAGAEKSSYVNLTVTTGTRTLEADSASGDAGTFRNTSGTANTVEIAGDSNILVLKSGALLTEAARFESDGTLVSAGEVSADDVSATSDRRLKDDLQPIEGALDKVAQIGGYTFVKSGRRNAGVIAQDVQKVLPEAVSKRDGYLTLSPTALQGLIVEAIKELREKVSGPADKR